MRGEGAEGTHGGIRRYRDTSQGKLGGYLMGGKYEVTGLEGHAIGAGGLETAG